MKMSNAMIWMDAFDADEVRRAGGPRQKMTLVCWMDGVVGKRLRVGTRESQASVESPEEMNSGAQFR
jgi:hypothetical protein